MVRTQEFNSAINESIGNVSELLAGAGAKSRREAIQTALKQNTESIKVKITDGLTACLMALKQHPELSSHAASVIKELKKCFSVIKNRKQLDVLSQTILQNSSWKKQLGISDECMLALYQSARWLFEQDDFQQAENAFFAICSIDPSQFVFWVGLGHACFHNAHYQQAIEAYAMSAALHNENAWPHIWAANCFESEGDFLHAKMALEEALSLAKRERPLQVEFVDSIKQKIQKM